jgi:hypothetical protein
MPMVLPLLKEGKGDLLVKFLEEGDDVDDGRKRRVTATLRKGARSGSRGVRGCRGSTSGSGGQGRPDVVDEEELKLSDFSVTNEDDEDLFTTDVPLKKNYMDNWYEKCVGTEHHADNAHEEGEEYADSE